MSVATQITRIKGNIAASYEQAEAKGAEMPDTLNSDNLPACIASIQTSPTPPPPTGDIAVIIYTYDSTNAKYVESVYTKASKGDTITLPAIADVAEANDGTANYNPALTADGWSGDAEVVGGQFTIPNDWKWPDIAFMACYYTSNGEMCYVLNDGTHHTSASNVCTNIFCNYSVSDVKINNNTQILRYVVGPNKRHISISNGASTNGAFLLGLVNFNQVNIGNTERYLQSANSLRRCIGKFPHAPTTMLRSFYANRLLQSLDLSGCNLSAVTTMQQTWMYCYALTNLNVSGMNLSNATDVSDAFTGCRNLTYITLAEDGQETGFFNFASGLTMDFSPCLYLGVSNGWKDHLLACTPQQSETKNIKLSAATISSFDEDELQQLQDRGYTIAT
ncbi:MAG: hypothetical protein HUK01_03560 [Bacteroidaceae bacterium]|nr:hypothetical protein [Bacteroidaceae bacterium]